MEQIDIRLNQLDKKVLITQINDASKVEQGWHAQLTQDALTDVDKLMRYVQDEVFLQFSMHVKNLEMLDFQAQQKRQEFQNEPVVKQSKYHQRLLEIENKQMRELNETRN